MRRMTATLALLVCGAWQSAHVQPLPAFELDPGWPTALPNKWALGQVRGLTTDGQDHVWVLNEGVPSDNAHAAASPPSAACCIPAPSVLEFDSTGKVLRSWGRPGFVPAWPRSPRGIHVDAKGHVWIGGVSSPWTAEPGATRPTEQEPWDRHVLKFSSDGKLLLQIGRPSNVPLDNGNPMELGPVSGIRVDDAAGEVYIADGYLNRRVLVFDSTTGRFKRGWGAYGVALRKIEGTAPESFPRTRDPAAAASRQFSGLTDLHISRDGRVYVADQGNARIQVFSKRGRFLSEFPVAPHVLGFEATWNLAVSRDPRERYLFVTDGESGVVRILDRRSGRELGSLGHKGRNAGQFSNLGWIAVDSAGRLYSGEVHFTRSWDGRIAAMTGRPQTPGGRLQRFTPREP